MTIGAAALGFTSWAPALFLTALAFASNQKLFGVFHSSGGLPFAVAALLFHQVYYLYGAAVFVYCHLTVKPDPQPPGGPS